jgi:hypothetical protein
LPGGAEENPEGAGSGLLVFKPRMNQAHPTYRSQVLLFDPSCSVLGIRIAKEEDLKGCKT